jgi:lysophospholipase L1-like esterase
MMTYPLSMPASGRRRPRRSWAALGAVALAVALVCALAAWRPWITPTVDAASPTQAPIAAVAPAALALPENPRVLVFGDSWVYGSAAIVPTLGFAYRLGPMLDADVVVDGVRGSGYLKPGIDGPAYGERVAALDPALDPDLVIIEGTINDRRLPAEGYRDAVTAVWDAVVALYPEATIVVMGPAPHVLPVEDAIARIDADLAELAAARGWWYISPVAENWIVAENYLSVIDTGLGRNHPSTEGHRYLAARVAESLAAMSQGTDVAADAPVGTEVGVER